MSAYAYRISRRYENIKLQLRKMLEAMIHQESSGRLRLRQMNIRPGGVESIMLSATVEDRQGERRQVSMLAATPSAYRFLGELAPKNGELEELKAMKVKDEQFWKKSKYLDAFEPTKEDFKAYSKINTEGKMFLQMADVCHSSSLPRLREWAQRAIEELKY